MKEIWIPTTEMKITIQDGSVSIKEEMTMTVKKIESEIGFKSENSDNT